MLLSYAQQLCLFGGGGGRRFAGGTIHHKVIYAAVDAEIEQPAPAKIVHRKIEGERGDQGHAGAMKYWKAGARIIHTESLGVSFVGRKSSAQQRLALHSYGLDRSGAWHTAFIPLYNLVAKQSFAQFL